MSKLYPNREVVTQPLPRVSTDGMQPQLSYPWFSAGNERVLAQRPMEIAPTWWLTRRR